MMGLRDRILALWLAAVQLAAWWVAELRGLVPARWRGRSQARIEARVDHRAIRISGWQPAPVDIPLDPTAPNAGPPRPSALPVWLVPPPGAVLSRVVQVPRAAAARFGALLQAEADRWTSFPVRDIACAWSLPSAIDDNRVEIELRFVPRALASSWAEALEAHNLAPTFLVLGPDERFRVRWRAVSMRRRLLERRTLLIGATVAAAVLLVCADWIAARREQGLWQERIGAQRLHLNRQRELETRVASLLATAGAAEATRTPPRALQLAALAAALPASDWLTELSFKDDALMLRGYAKNVEVLLKALEPLARDGVVTVQGELALDARLERQRFTVNLRTREVR